MTRPYHTRFAMTLVEILAVVVILGLLAVTLTVGLAGKMGKAKHEIAKTQIGQLVGQLQTYQLEKRSLPKAGDGLAVLTTPAASPTAAYFVDTAKLTDPWGNPYQLLIPGPEGHPFEIISYGADGQPGGTDENADVSSVTMGK
jgi:general secretion pathway protein G